MFVYDVSGMRAHISYSYKTIVLSNNAKSPVTFCDVAIALLEYKPLSFQIASQGKPPK